MARTTKLCIAAAVLVCTALVVALLHQPAPPAIVLPNPNGYDDFVQATQIVVQDPLQNQPNAPSRPSVEENAKALALVRTGLAKQCRVPIEYDEGYVAKLMPRLASFKLVAHAFVGEGKLAEQENRSNDAVQSYLDCVKFGEESVRGGVLIEKLVGLACEAIGMRELRRLSVGLLAADAQKLLGDLTKIQSNQESPEDWIKQEKVWSRFSFKGWRSTLVRWVMRKSMRESEKRAIEKHSRQQAELRLLRGDLALKLYHLEKGLYPGKLAELVPRYLDSVPRDPFGDQPLVYRAQTNSYLLYSIGPDRQDDGGVALTPNRQGKGDILSTAP